MASTLELTKLKKRALTALIVAPISFFAIYQGGLVFLVLLAAFFTLSHYEWWQMAKKLTPFSLYYPLGVVYLCFCFFCFYKVGIGKNLDAVIVLLLVITSDVGAYFAGKLIGGPKMAAKISPNKTWAGLGGAMLCPAIILVCVEIVQPGKANMMMLGLYLFFGALIGLFGQIGDILVSLMKRRAQVKDTGNLLPGHGGVLDRIDSLLLAVPVFMVLEYLIAEV